MLLAEQVEARAAAAPDQVAVRHAGTALSYAGLAARAAGLAGGLHGLGIQPGDRVAVLAYNHPDTLALLLACSWLGAALAPLNWRLAPPELRWILGHARPRVLVVDAACAGMVDPASVPGIAVVPMAALPLAPRPAEVGSNGRPLVLIYTSGTTGRPKGAVLTGDALLANAGMSRHMHAMTAGDRVLTVLPLFHVGGLNIQTTPALLLGATVILHPRFDAGLALQAIATDRPTLTVLVPSTLQALYGHPAWDATDVGSLRAVTTGSVTVAASATAPFQARGVPVLQVYGATETCPMAIYTALGSGHQGAGVPGPGCEARATDDRGREVPDGQPGEIILRGPQLFTEYWDNPEATLAVLHGGWFRTGDIGTRGADGCWTVHDRKKHLIVSGGENVYPAEIERVLHEHPAVLDAAVTGRPDPRWQHVPVAYVVLRPQSAISGAELIEYLRTQLAGFKVPRRVHVLPALPRNAMGKIQHTELPAP